MNEHESKKNKRKKRRYNKKSDEKKEKQVNTKPEGNNQTEEEKIETPGNSEDKIGLATESDKVDGGHRTEEEKIETPGNSEDKICLATESDKVDGGSRTSKKINAPSVSEPEIARKMEDNSGSCDSKMLTDDKHFNNKEVEICSQTPRASVGDYKTNDEASQKVKESGSASYHGKLNYIRQGVGGSGQSNKMETNDSQFSRGGQWSSMRGKDSGQDRPHSTSVQSNTRGYVMRARSAEKSIDPGLHSAHFHLSGRKENFHFFFERHCPLSQHYMSEFKIDGVKYNCCEQFMMQQKALTFKDEESAKKIMSTSEPNVQKRLGRMVKNFDGEVWNKVCMDVVKKANMAKFSQNPKLKEMLLKTGSKVLVEASPYDRIWGIGIARDHADAPCPEHWLGENRLGRILMEVRDELSRELKPK